MNNIYQLAVTIAVIIILLFIYQIIRSCINNSKNIEKNKRGKNKYVQIENENPFTLKKEFIKLCNKNSSGCIFPKFKNPCCVTHGVTMLSEVFEIFNMYSVPIWLTGNTLLGCHRYSGFISWESKLELATCNHRYLKNIFELLESKGYPVKYNPGKYILHYSSSNKLEMDIVIKSGEIELETKTMYGLEVQVPQNWEDPVEDIDVLFIGSMDPRRRKIYEELIHKLPNKKIVFKSNVMSADKDLLISRAKIVLNIHQGNMQILEIVGLSKLLANKKYVISEKSGEPDVDTEWSQGVIISEYNQIVDKVVSALENEHFIKNQEEKGYQFIQRKKQKLPVPRNPYIFNK